jgi:methylmalonyl-CoA mutase cobalamin-binding subunit
MVARILLSTVSSDSHTWNLVYLTLLLEEHGYQVNCLGACVPDELLISTALRQRPDAIVISSVNGHGALDGARLVRALRGNPEMASTPVIIGGKLGLVGAGGDAHSRPLLDAGFTAVFGDTGGEELIDALTGLIRSEQDGVTGNAIGTAGAPDPDTWECAA